MANLVEDTPVSSSQSTPLPDDVLHLITNKLHNVFDYVQFSAVCKDWLSFCHKTYKEKHHLHTNQQLPLLLVPTQFSKEMRGLYNITKNMSHDQIQLQLPNKRCCGSSHGWLFFANKFNKFSSELILINPFLGTDDKSMIKLPPIKFTRDDRVGRMDQYGVYKAIMSKDPHTSPDDYEIMAIYGGYRKLAHYKSGDKFWSYPITETLQEFADVIFHNGSIYAVDRYNWFVRVTLERFKITSGSSTDDDCSPCYLRFVTIKRKLSVRRRNYAGHGYLVENSRGDLLLVRRYYWAVKDLLARDAEDQDYLRWREILEARRDQEMVEDHQMDDDDESGSDSDDDDDESDSDDDESDSDDEISSDEEVYDKPNLTVCFRVFELTMSPERKLLRLKNLSGEIFFLGDNHSISVSASECPGLSPNSIYYTDDFDTYEQNIYFGSCDSGVYNVKNGKKSKHFVPSFSAEGMQPPIFVVPRFRCNPKRILQL